MTAPKVRVSFAPLLRASRVAEGGGVLTHFTVPHTWTTESPHEQECRSVMSALADLLGAHRKTLLRYRDDGIPLDAAEDYAFLLGSHPAVIWGDEWLFAAGCPLASVCAKGNLSYTTNPHPHRSTDPQAPARTINA